MEQCLLYGGGLDGAILLIWDGIGLGLVIEVPTHVL
jgi:hypothetical protein